MEVLEFGKTDFVRDLIEVQGCLFNENYGVVNTEFVEILDEGFTGDFFEDHAEIGAGDTAARDKIIDL